MQNLSVDHLLVKAKSHVKKEELSEAQELYNSILNNFPENKRALQELIKLNNLIDNTPKKNYSQQTVNHLINLYNEGKFEDVISSSEFVTQQHPEAFVIWNIIGSSAINLGLVEKAINAYNKSISLNPDHAETYLNKGLALKIQGKFYEAIIAYKKSISLKPDYPNAYCNMGNAFLAQGMIDQAISSYNKAISLKPDYADAYNNMGIAFKTIHNYDQAFIAYSNAIAIKKNYAEAYSNISVVFKYQGELDKAISACKMALSLKPNYADAYNNLGNALKAQGNFDQAISAYKKVLSINPNHGEVYNNIGLIFHNKGKFEDAIKNYKMAILTNPKFSEAYNNMGNSLQELSEFDQAIYAYEKTIMLNPNHAHAYNNMGVVFKNLGKPSKAMKAFKKSISLNPDYAEAYSNIGLTFQNQGKLHEAIEFYNKSILLNPKNAEVHQNLSLALLNNGKFKEGLDEYEWRWKTRSGLFRQRYFSNPIWDGKKSLKGKRVLIWCEQGIGDTLNWSSYLPLITARAEHCIFECQEKIVPLLERSFPEIEVKPQNRNNDMERNDFDFHMPIGSLYKYFINEINQKIKAKPFLVPDPIRVNYWKEILHNLGTGPFVGISWKSTNISPARQLNYANISDLSPILKLSDLTFINLQYKDFKTDLIKIKNDFGVKVHNFESLDHYNNLDDVAALCRALDFVVSTKITVASISAGVGTSTKLANWRQSNWNNALLHPIGPLVDIFQRDSWDTWDGVFKLIAEDIKKYK